MTSSNIIADALTTRRLHLILLPTEQCNFRCKYCYEDFQHGRAYGSVRVIDPFQTDLASVFPTGDL